ncbi:MAG: hypothetical protein RSC76_06195, partial [Oscillospiraceae bacterium]
AIRTEDFLYIINFKPDRWPAGNPKGLDDYEMTPPSYDELQHNTFTAYYDMDASPTKAWMIHHRNDGAVKPLFELAFSKRPYEELYDLKNDKNYLNNIADNPDCSGIKCQLKARLMKILIEEKDPRICEDPCRFELPPYAGELQDFQRNELISLLSKRK